MTRQREHAADGIDRVYEGALAGGGGDEVSDLVWDRGVEAPRASTRTTSVASPGPWFVTVRV